MEAVVQGALAVLVLLGPPIIWALLASGVGAARVLCALALLGEDATPEQVQRTMLGLNPYLMPIRRVHRALRQMEALGKVRRREAGGRWVFSCTPKVQAEARRGLQ